MEANESAFPIFFSFSLVSSKTQHIQLTLINNTSMRQHKSSSLTILYLTTPRLPRIKSKWAGKIVTVFIFFRLSLELESGLASNLSHLAYSGQAGARIRPTRGANSCQSVRFAGITLAPVVHISLHCVSLKWFVVVNGHSSAPSVDADEFTKCIL